MVLLMHRAAARKHRCADTCDQRDRWRGGSGTGISNRVSNGVSNRVSNGINDAQASFAVRASRLCIQPFGQRRAQRWRQKQLRMADGAASRCIALPTGVDRTEQRIFQAHPSRAGGGQQREIAAEARVVVACRARGKVVGPLPDQQCLRHPAQAAAGRHPQHIASVLRRRRSRAGRIGPCRIGPCRFGRCALGIAGEAVKPFGIVCLQQLMRDHRVQDRLPLAGMEIVDPGFAALGRAPPAQQRGAGRGEAIGQHRISACVRRKRKLGQQFAGAVVQSVMQRRRVRAHGHR